MSITTRCANTDVQKILSSAGVTLRTDDDTEAALWAREEAALELNLYLSRRYSDSALAASNWVARAEAWLAAFRLCGRRNNPIPESLWTEINGKDKQPGLRDRLELIRVGKLDIPDAMTRKADVPVLSNIRERLAPFPQPVVVEGTSTGVAASYPRHTDTQDYFDYTV